MSQNNIFFKHFLPKFAGMLLSLMVMLPKPGSANILLGIVRSPENSDEWNQIITRIQASGISYQPIDLTQINTVTDLSGIKVIFLPNIEKLTQTQLQILQEWVKQGGKLIASGQVGKKSRPGVRQKLRSLLGSYWAFPLNQPTIPESRYRCLDIACKESTSWAPTENQGAVQGGVLIPAGLNSSTAATWKGSSGSSAVVITPHATYLGWHWGKSSSATLDSAWLQAALSRYQSQPQFAPGNNPLPMANQQPLPTSNSNPVKIRPQILPSPAPTNSNLNQPVVTQNSTPDNIWTRSKQHRNENRLGNSQNQRATDDSEQNSIANQPPQNIQTVQSNQSIESADNNSNLQTETVPRSNNVWQRFRQQIAEKNQQKEQVSKSETVVNSNENPTPQTTKKRGGSIWNNLRQNNSNQGSSNQQQTQATGSSSRRSPITALLRPLAPPQVQVPISGTDPSSESAPPGLDVRQGNYPISRAEAYAMLQELNNLLGRFESALVAAKSANVEVNLAADGSSSLVAANTNQTTFVAQRNREITNAQKIITQARQVIQTFPQQVASKQYATARRQWLQTRQMLWENYPTDGQRAGAEIRAVWLDRGTIVRARSERGLAMVFDRLAAAGINTVFFETINAGYTIYPSNVAPKQNPLTISWDPLEAAVKLARERNMEIHAWLWTFAVGNQAHNRAINQPDSYLGPVISAHPSWVMTDKKGRKRHPSDGKVYMDPANPYVRQYLLKIIDEIASRYQVDGIQLDYIRYPFQNPGRNFSYGYSTTARQQFQQLYGVDPMKISPRDRQNRWKWTEFKINQVNTFVTWKRKHSS